MAVAEVFTIIGMHCINRADARVLYTLVYFHQGNIIGHELCIVDHRLSSCQEVSPESDNVEQSTYTGHLALGTDLRTVEGEYPGDESKNSALYPNYQQEYPQNRDQATYNSTQQTRRLGKTKVGEHGSRHHGKHTTEQIPATRLRRNRRTGISMVRIGQVVEGSQVDREDAHGCTADGQRRHDPGYRREGGPSEPEEADGEKNRFNADEVKTSFGGGG